MSMTAGIAKKADLEHICKYNLYKVCTRYFDIKVQKQADQCIACQLAEFNGYVRQYLIKAGVLIP